MIEALKNIIKISIKYSEYIYVYILYHKKIKNIINNNSNIRYKLSFQPINAWKSYGYYTFGAWNKFYSSVNGIYSEEYVPENIFYSFIERKLNYSDLALAYGDKNNYDRIIDKIEMPKTFIKNINGKFYNNDKKIISMCDAKNLILNNNCTYIIKPSLDTGGGRNVAKISVSNKQLSLDGKNIKIVDLFNYYDKNYLIQEVLTQYDKFKKFHPASVNTIRIMSLRVGDDIKIISTVVRFGNNDSSVDNQRAGGVSCGVDKNGKFNEYAVDKNGNIYRSHPYSNVEFAGNKIPRYLKLKKIIAMEHKKLKYFDLISWDIAIDENVEFTLLEFNLQAQEINFHQLNNGPLFGDNYNYVMKTINER